MERRSRNTMENAEFSKAAGGAEKRRAVAVGDVGLSHAALDRHLQKGRICRLNPIRSTGVPADPSILLEFSPFVLDGLERTEIAVREYLGLVAYRISGKTSELFPGPNPQ